MNTFIQTGLTWSLLGYPCTRYLMKYMGLSFGKRILSNCIITCVGVGLQKDNYVVDLRNNLIFFNKCDLYKFTLASGLVFTGLLGISRDVIESLFKLGVL